MDFAFIGYLQQMGTDPASYIKLQASYLRFLAEQINSRSKSWTFPGDPICPSPDKPKNAKKQSEPNFTASDIKPNLYAQNFQEESLKKAHKISHDDIPIQPVSTSYPLSSSHPEPIRSPLSKSKSLQKKFLYLKKNPNNLSASNTKRLKIPVDDDKDHRKTRSTSEVSKKNHAKSQDSAVKQAFLKKGEGKLCARPSESSTSISPKKSVMKQYIKTEDSPKKFSKSSEVVYTHMSEGNSNARYSKMLKDLEIKTKKFEKDCEEFYRVRDKETKALNKWKIDEKRKIDQEIEVLEKQMKNLQGKKNKVDDLNAEAEGLRLRLEEQEEKYKEEVRGMERIVEELKMKNKDLIKELGPVGIKEKLAGNSLGAAKSKEMLNGNAIGAGKNKESPQENYGKIQRFGVEKRKSQGELKEKRKDGKEIRGRRGEEHSVERNREWRPQKSYNFDEGIEEGIDREKQIVIPVLRLDKIWKGLENNYLPPGKVITKKSYLSQFAEKSKIPVIKPETSDVNFT